MATRRETERRRRASAAVYRRRRLVALAVVAVAIVAAVLVVRGRGHSPTIEEVVRQGREAQPVHFTMAFSGDLLIHTAVWERALALGGGTNYDFAAELDQLRPYVATADLGVCHVETPMTSAPPTSYPIFNTPPALATGIAATGWDACDTASNHSLDQHQEGIDATGKALDRAGVKHTGSYPSAAAQRRPLILDANGVKVALLAYTTDTNGLPKPNPWSVIRPSEPRVLADARRARRAGADAVVVNLHWGAHAAPEYVSDPSPVQLALVRKLTASPLITAIVGQGPHTVQPIERINGKYVVFSEGNLISNQSPAAGLPASSEDGLVALLDCVKDIHGVRVQDVQYVPVFVSQPDYEVLPVGDALRKGEGDATLLRDSYQRTVSVAGRGRGIEPIPPHLPG